MLSKLNIWVFGTSGTGKSALCSALINDRTQRIFPQTKSSFSSSQEVIHQRHVTLRTGQEANLVDTEGFSNPNIPEQTLYDRTYESLKTLKTVDRFVLVLNSTEPRLDIKLQKTISLFLEMVGVGMLNNLTVAFTRWSYDSRSVKTRERQKLSEITKSEEIRAFFNSKFGFNGFVPCFFVDCTFEEEDEGANRCVEQLEALIKSCKTSTPCQTGNIKTVNVNPVINYNTYSNTQSGDAYNRSMASRKKIISKIEAYFDNRQEDLSPSLINTVHKNLKERNQREETFWILEQNYKAHQTNNLSQELYQPVQFTLNKILEENLDARHSQLNLRKDLFRVDQEEKENTLLNQRSGLVLIFGIILGLILGLLFDIKWYVAIFVGILACSGIYVVILKMSWNVAETNKQIAASVTQKIAYTNGLKRYCIDFADQQLEGKNS